MDLHAVTKPGAALVELAERLATEVAPSVAAHDRAGTHPLDQVDALARAGWFTAPIPVELGGLGVSSTHDLLVASSRLARGHASLAIAANMHVMIVRNIVARWAASVIAGRDDRSAGMADLLRRLVDEREIVAAAVSEPGQDLTAPGTVAVRVADGWRLDGHKIFCSLSPSATTLLTSARYEHRSGEWRYGFFMVPATTPGVTVLDDWDALGMRASGSNSVRFDGAVVPADALTGGFRVGDTVAYAERNLTNGAFHAAACVGIAEMAHQCALAPLRGRVAAGTAVEPAVERFVVDNEIDLAVLRGALSRAGHVLDAHDRQYPDRAPTDAVVDLFAEVQSAKAAIAEVAPRVVDRALLLSGGAGYRNDHPLSRAARDVRATAFMHPLNSVKVGTLLADRALGRPPELH
jgi:alkylation response protein AidB-like acyl-CoA dehydrogenase